MFHQIEVTLCGVQVEKNASVVCSRGVRITPDTTFATSPEITQSVLYDVVIVPGGMGNGKGALQLANVRKKHLNAPKEMTFTDALKIG